QLTDHVWLPWVNEVFESKVVDVSFLTVEFVATTLLSNVKLHSIVPVAKSAALTLNWKANVSLSLVVHRSADGDSRFTAAPIKIESKTTSSREIRKKRYLQ
ncbi:hypothetical protein KY349_04985, partial [Candidatus Woesearchaeota archaeon]|nr:hypothetical protein [Candidatus Woesearchaeota archaeon]